MDLVGDFWRGTLRRDRRHTHRYCGCSAYVIMLLRTGSWRAQTTITILSSQDFNRNPGGAKKAANDGPVFIADGGQPTHVLLTIEAYNKLAFGNVSIVELLSMPGDVDIDFDPPRLQVPITRTVDLSD